MYILCIVRDLENKIPARRIFLTPFGPTPVREIRLIAIWCGSDQTKVIAIAYKCWLLCTKSFKKGFACAQIHDTYTFGHSLMHEIIQVAIRCGSDQTKLIAIAYKCWLLCQKWFKKGFRCTQIHDTYNFISDSLGMDRKQKSVNKGFPWSKSLENWLVYFNY